MDTTLPWNLAPELPWRMLSSPAQQWDRLPSFLVGEYLFIALALVALWHARREGRAHLLVWVSAIVAGTMNDIIFMALPVVDNFWQSQATIMLTPRLPLYIPCVYVCFMYYPTVSVWRLRLPQLPRATLTGLSAIIFYAPYDIIGAKFLWWTWHDTDAPIADRLVGVPVGSTIWVITFVATFAFLVGRAVDRDPEMRPAAFARTLATVAALCTFLMVVQMTVLQQVDGGTPGYLTLIAAAVIYAVVVARGLRAANPQLVKPTHRVLHRALVVYFATLVGIMALSDPEAHRAESLHQTYGACGVKAKDLMGNIRHKYLCAEDYDEDFSFACVDSPPAAGTQWYTVCGKAHSSFPLWMGAVGGLGAVGVLLYSLLLGALAPRRESAVDSPSAG